MLRWTIEADYDPDRRLWYVSRSNVTDLCIEAETLEAFKAEVARLCEERAAGGDFSHTVSTSLHWSLRLPFMRRALVNGRMLSQDQARDVAAQYESARRPPSRGAMLLVTGGAVETISRVTTSE